MPNSKILVVDDNPCDVFLLEHALSRVDIPVEIEVASDEDEALQALDVEPAPDLLVVDFGLPGATGLDILRTAQANPNLGNIPAVLLSSVLAPEQRAAANALGALSIEKPFSLQGWTHLASQISSLLSPQASITAA